MPSSKRATSHNDVSKQSLVLLEKIVDNQKQILAVIQDLFILEGARAGMSNAEIRKTVKVINKRVSAIAKHFPQATDSRGD